MSAEPGDWVRTGRHRHHGMVLAVYPDCPENSLWQKTQNLSEQEMAGPWALLYVPGTDTVMVPVSDCEPAEAAEWAGLPDQIVIEAFGPTEEEAASIAAGLAAMGEGTTTQVGVATPPPDMPLEVALQQLAGLIRSLPTEEGEADG